MKEKDNMTISELAGMVSSSFIHVQHQFDKMDQKFEKIDQRFDMMDKKIDNFRSEILGEFRKLEKRIDVIELKLDRIEKNNIEEIENELGDLLFSLVNYSRFLNINPENALRRTNQKFIKRFQYIEAELKKIGKSVTDSNLEEMDKYWNESKKII